MEGRDEGEKYCNNISTYLASQVDCRQRNIHVALRCVVRVSRPKISHHNHPRSNRLVEMKLDNLFPGFPLLLLKTSLKDFKTFKEGLHGV